MELILLLKTATILILGMFVGFYFRAEKLTIREYERGLLFKNGTFKKELGPGRYNIAWNAKINLIDMRRENYFVKQNVLTSDNIHVGVNITVRTKVKDAYKAFTSSQDFRQDAHDLTRSIIKEVGHKTKVKTLIREEDKFEEKLKSPLNKELKEIGMELVRIELIDAQIPHSVQESIADSLDDLVKTKEKKTKKVGFLKG